ARKAQDPNLDDLKAIWMNVALTYDGIKHFDQDAVRGFDEKFTEFKQGAADRADDLGDTDESAPQHWVIGGPGLPSVHAILTIAADDPTHLSAEVNKQGDWAVNCGLQVIYQQRGDALPGQNSGREHFGFKDGVSQPGVDGYTPDPDKDHPGRKNVAASNFIIEDPPDGLDWMRNGSFQVFR